MIKTTAIIRWPLLAFKRHRFSNKSIPNCGFFIEFISIFRVNIFINKNINYQQLKQSFMNKLFVVVALAAFALSCNQQQSTNYFYFK
jgi:uncharacterized membrane protein YwaF